MKQQKIIQGIFAARQLLKEGWLVKHVFTQKEQIGSSGSKESAVTYRYKDIIYFVMELQDEALSEPRVHEIKSQNEYDR